MRILACVPEVTMTVKLGGPTPNDPLTVYYLAQSFYLAGRRRLLNIEVGPGLTQCLTSPGVVNLCFSAELFMKVLIISSGASAPKLHKLKDLFGNLREEDRTTVSDIYQRTISRSHGDILLDQVDDYFVKVRYEHEFDVFAFHEHAITMFADALYRHCAVGYGQAVGIDRVRI